MGEWLKTALAYQSMDVVLCAASKRDLPSQIHRAFHSMARAQVALYRRFAKTLATSLEKKLPPAMVGAADREKAIAAAQKIVTRETPRIFKPYPAQSEKLIRASLATIYQLAKTWTYRQGLGVEDPGDFAESTPARFGHTGKAADPGIYVIAKAQVNPSLTAALNAVDKKAIEALAKAQNFWLTREFAEPMGLNQTLNKLVQHGIFTQGRSAKEMRERIAEKLQHQLDYAEAIAGKLPMGRAQYAEFLAVNTASVAKTYGSISGLQEAGVTRYVVMNPLDERTCPVCSFMEGTSYTVSHGMERIESLSGMEPQAFKESWPWMSNEKQVKDIAGTSDPKALTPEKKGDVMGKAGRSFPPYHGRCRCVVAADFDTIGGIVWPQGSSAPLKKPPEKLLPKKPKTNTGRAIRPSDLKKHGGYRQPNGTTIPSDGKYVENQALHFRTEAIDGKDHIIIRFKLTEKDAEQIRRAIVSHADSSDDMYTWRPFKRSTNMAEQLSEGGVVQKAGQPASIGTRYTARAVYKIGTTDVAYTMPEGAQGTFSNLVEVSIRTKQPDIALKVFRESLKRVKNPIEGVDDLMALSKMPTKAEQTAMFKAKIIGVMDQQAAAALRRTDLSAEKIDTVWKNFIKDNPRAKKILRSTEMVEVAPGHMVPYSKELAVYMEEQGVVGYTHKWYGGVEETLIKVLKDPNKGGLLSSRNRYQRGIFTDGMSTSKDFRTGGADSVFTRLKFKTADGVVKEQGGTVVIHLRQEVAGRLDRYAFASDQYGAAGPNMLPSRLFDRQIRKKFDDYGWNSDNETMFLNQIGLKDVEKIRVGAETYRRDLLYYARQNGLTEVNGKPIEDFIEVAGRGW